MTYFIRLMQRKKRTLSPCGAKRPWEIFPRPATLKEATVSLSEEEAAWVNVESLRLMRARRQEEARKRALGIPPPPTPGKISYAVFM